MDKKHFVIFSSETRASVPGPAGAESLGYQLHNLYCAYEDLLEIIAAACENQIDSTSGYHLELLKRMRMPIADVRPQVISDESFLLLDSLRAFRHVFRHAYAVSLDERKLHVVLEDARSLHSKLREEIEAFLSAVHVEDVQQH